MSARSTKQSQLRSQPAHSAQRPLHPLRGYHAPVQHVDAKPATAQSLPVQLAMRRLQPRFDESFRRRLYQKQLDSIEYSRSAQVDASSALSATQNGAVAANCGLTCLDFDHSENRYLLSGDQRGRIALYDTRLPSHSTRERLKRHRSIEHSAQTEYRITALSRDEDDCRSNNASDKHSRSVTSVNWFPLDTGLFISSSMDRCVKVWDTETQSVASSFNLSAHVYAARMSRLNQAAAPLIACASASQHVRLIDLRAQHAHHTLMGHSKAVTCLAWSNRREFELATGSQDQVSLLACCFFERAKQFITDLTRLDSTRLGSTRLDMIDHL